MDSEHVLGAGSFGLVISNQRNAVKLFYDIYNPHAILEEARLQTHARNVLQGIVRVPEIHGVSTIPTSYRATPHLRGIEMDRISIVEGMPSATHVLLGYDQSDIDTEWSRDHCNPPSDSNPTRGFHAGPEMMEAIWEDEGRSDITIEYVAYTMGIALRTLIDNGIIPYDLEWIYGGGELYLIDFGMCWFGTVDPWEYLYRTGSSGLASDYYIPHKGCRGYEAFLKGYARLDV